jgi:hypothetical protein
MFVKTDFMKTSGQGNPVFFKQGALNRFKHMAFLDRHWESQRVKEDL